MNIEKTHNLLYKFSKQVEKISNKKYDNISKIKFSWNINQAESIVESSFPKGEVYILLLMDMRAITMKKSCIYFNEICEYFLVKGFMAEEVKKYKERFESIWNSKVIGIKIDNTELTPKYIFKTITNENFFHQELDGKGMKKIEQHPMINSLSWFQFFDILDKLRKLFILFDIKIVKQYYNNNI